MTEVRTSLDQLAIETYIQNHEYKVSCHCTICALKRDNILLKADINHLNAILEKKNNVIKDLKKLAQKMLES